MDSDGNDIFQEVEEIFNNIMTKGNIQLNKLYIGEFSKGMITFMNKLISNYINTNSHKGSNIGRFITFLSKKFSKRPLDNINKFSTKNKTSIKTIILLIYLMIYRNQLSIMNSKEIEKEKKYLSIKKLYHLLKKMTPILSKLYIDKIFELFELEIIMKMLIIFTVNDKYEEIKENNDIKNIMYLKVCLNIILATFNEKSSEIEQKLLVDIFDYINNVICYMDKNDK
jgi:hypothetical protein